MTNPIALFSEKGEVVLTLSAKMDSGEECIFTDIEFSKEKNLLFRSTGSFMYTLKNYSSIPIQFILEDIDGKRVNSADYLSPKSKVNLHCHSDEKQLLEFKDTTATPFKFTVLNINGVWKLYEDDDQDTSVLDEFISGSNEIDDLDQSLTTSFQFYHVYKKDIIFLTREPINGDRSSYIEKICCICLDGGEDLCTFIRCGHKCSHLKCFFDSTKKPHFVRCPLCRENIMAVTL
jgi:hypothetical protein